MEFASDCSGLNHLLLPDTKVIVTHAARNAPQIDPEPFNRAILAQANLKLEALDFNTSLRPL